jgi:type III restriction enzyme
VLYAKLPSKFKVDTPFGGYNPDWMVVLKPEGEDFKLYFVAETKGTTDIDKLKPDEKNKILCGKKHFEVLNNELKYKVVNTLIDLKNNM